MRYVVIINGAVVTLGIGSELPANAVEVTIKEYAALRAGDALTTSNVIARVAV